MKTNNNIPAYRFQGYTDAWELRKLGELGTFKNGMNFSKDAMGTGFPFINLQNIFGKNVVDISQLGLAMASSIQLKNYNLQKGDVLFVRSSVKLEGVGETAIVPKNLEDTTYSGFIIRYRDSFGMDINFKRYTFGTNNIRNQIMSQATDSANKNISQQVLAELDILVPSLPEQETIGTFFSSLDRHITLHQRKLDTLKEQKKTYLKLLFPVKGQTKPALRFQGFEDDWEEVKLGELCDIRTGKLDANAMVENGKYDFYTSGIKKYKIDVAEFEGPAITIAGNGATVGYMHLADGKFNAYQRTYVLTNFKVDRSYIFSEVAEKLPMKIQQEARTGNIPYIVLSMLTELSISLPSLPEQEAIGTFFRTLDQEIAQVEAKLASLKEMKKTLLRKLFV
jgi:type I restriction enzyme S subunit